MFQLRIPGRGGQGAVTAAEMLLADFEFFTPGTTRTRGGRNRPRLEPVRRRATFEEVVQELDPANALHEACRCKSCGIRVSECPCGAIEMAPEEI